MEKTLNLIKKNLKFEKTASKSMEKTLNLIKNLKFEKTASKSKEKNLNLIESPQIVGSYQKFGKTSAK